MCSFNSFEDKKDFKDLITMRIKTNIETLESPLDKITKLRGVSYNLKKNNEPSIGMIAEEVIVV